MLAGCVVSEATAPAGSRIVLSAAGERTGSSMELACYCNEFSYRFNRRGEQLAMFDATLKNLVRGEALPYKKLTSPVSA
jgi:hypothetical protein